MLWGVDGRSGRPILSPDSVLEKSQSDGRMFVNDEVGRNWS